MIASVAALVLVLSHIVDAARLDAQKEVADELAKAEVHRSLHGHDSSWHIPQFWSTREKTANSASDRKPCRGKEVAFCGLCSQENCSRCYYIVDALHPAEGAQCLASSDFGGACLSSKAGSNVTSACSVEEREEASQVEAARKGPALWMVLIPVAILIPSAGFLYKTYAVEPTEHESGYADASLRRPPRPQDCQGTGQRQIGSLVPTAHVGEAASQC
mmetsp:Transcript_47993/g.88334  ORF Transcript_47993/g.88334 Transcript_47993/m.88334 type:complete len:217 (+) Transcript_47993:148-798(+)